MATLPSRVRFQRCPSIEKGLYSIVKFELRTVEVPVINFRVEGKSMDKNMQYSICIGKINSRAEILDPFYLSKLMDGEFRRTGVIKLEHLMIASQYLDTESELLEAAIKGLRDSDVYHDQSHYQEIADDLKRKIDLFTQEGKSVDGSQTNEWWSAYLVAENAKDRIIGEPLNQERYQDLTTAKIKKLLGFLESGIGLGIIQPEELQCLVSNANGSSYISGLELANHFSYQLTKIRLEISRFESAFEKVYSQIDLVKNVFSSQKITYINGEADYSKIHRLLKKNFGYDYPHSMIWFGSVICAAMSTIENQKNNQLSTLQIGLGFENYVEKLYKGLGYSVSPTPSTGDFGVDLIAVSNTEKVAIQCKKYATPVGPDAVMQVFSGGAYYECTRYAVFSINGFTDAATEMAKKIRVELFNIESSEI